MVSDKHKSAGKTLAGLLKVAPWSLSAAVHIAIACVLTFVYMLTIHPASEEIAVPDVRLSALGPARPAPKPQPVEVKPADKPEALKPLDLSEVKLQPTGSEAQLDNIELISPDNNPAELDLWDSSDFDDASQVETRFFDATGQAMNIVYVADWSGSLISGGTYDTVLAELRRSISELSPSQYFHVILFSSGKPAEMPARRLLPATDKSKLAAWSLVRSEKPNSRTEPALAIKRAFEVLKNAPAKRPGKLIYLLTDGFLDIAELRATLAKLNSRHDISVNIILHQDQRTAVRQSLADIAAENSGMLAFIEPN